MHLLALVVLSTQLVAHSDTAAQRLYDAGDAGFRGGRVRADTHVAHTWLPQALFKQHRDAVQSFDKSLPPGRYLVRVNLIERDPAVAWAQARVFSIRGPGFAFEDIDVWEQAGGHHVPLQQVALATLADGHLHMDFAATAGSPTVSSVQVEALKPPQAFASDDGKPLEDWRRFASSQALVAAGSSDDKSGWISPGVADGALRFDYAVDQHLPYGNIARFVLPLPQAVDLKGQHTLTFDLQPDGSGRTFGVTLGGAAGQSASFWLPMRNAEARRVKFSLDHVTAGDVAKDSSPPLAFAVTHITFSVKSDAGAALGHGRVLVGPVRATSEQTPLPPPRVRSGFEATAQALRIDGFETYPDNRALWDNVASTSHANVAMLSLAKGKQLVGHGKQSLRVDYTFDKRAYSGVVFMRPMDIRPYNAFRFWLKGDGSRNKLMVFFALGQIHQFTVPLENRTGQWIVVPLSTFLGATARREGVVEIGLWARRHGNSEGGRIYLDDVGLVFDPALPQGPAPPPMPVPLDVSQGARIDVGSDVNFVDASGQKWLADTGFQFGRTHILNPGELAFYAPPLAQLHQTFRVGMAGYAFAVPNGAYTVSLLMAENWLGAQVPGRRVCHIKVAGQDLGDVDIMAITKQRFKPLVKDVKAVVTNNVLQLDFEDKANHCKLDALQITPAR